MLKGAVAFVLVVSFLAFAQSTVPSTAVITPAKNTVSVGETAVLKYGCPSRMKPEVDARYLSGEGKLAWTTSDPDSLGYSEIKLSGLTGAGEVRVTLSCIPTYGPGLVRKGQFAYTTLNVVAAHVAKPASTAPSAQAEYDQAAAGVATATANLNAARARLRRATEACKATKGCKLSR